MKIFETVEQRAGLYTVNEAAMYARMNRQTLSNWLYGSSRQDALRRAKISKDEGKYLTFVELEALAIRNLRINYKLPLPKIREALDVAKGEFQIEYPFAHKEHKTFIEGKDLHIVLKGEELPIQITGRKKGQSSAKLCLENFMEDLIWDNDKKVASAYIAHRYSDEVTKQNVLVSMKPERYFGAPIVEGTGHTAETLWRAALAEGSIERAAEIYEVTPAAVRAALGFCDKIEMAA